MKTYLKDYKILPELYFGNIFKRNPEYSLIFSNKMFKKTFNKKGNFLFKNCFFNIRSF